MLKTFGCRQFQSDNRRFFHFSVLKVVPWLKKKGDLCEFLFKSLIFAR